MHEDAYEDEDADGSQHYQVNVVILEARHLSVVSADSKVVVNIGNRTKTVRSKTAKTDSPYFNELCIFNFYVPLPTLLDEILRVRIYGVPKLRMNKLIGSFSVELATIWMQPNHQFYHKWAVLMDPNNPTAGVKGYVKCDIGILTEGTKAKPTTRDPADTIEEHLLVPYGEVSDRQRAKFVFTIFRADNFSNAIAQPFRALYAFVRITFAGIAGKTSVAAATFTPSWNEELSFVDMIPSLCRYVHVEICDALKTSARRTIGVANLDLRRLSHEREDGFLPTYGPSFLYMYNDFRDFEHRNKFCLVSSSFTYVCRVLIALRTELADYAEDVLVEKTKPSAAVKPKSITPLDETKYFHYQEFMFFAAVFDILLFDPNLITSSVKIHVNIGPEKEVGSVATFEEDTDEKKKKNSSEEQEATDDAKDAGLGVGEDHGNPEETEVPKVKSSKRRRARENLDKARGWKPLKELEHWPMNWKNRQGQTEGPKKRRPQDAVREWPPLRTLRTWPTEWRGKRVRRGGSVESDSGAKKPKLSRSPRKKFRNWRENRKAQKVVDTDSGKDAGDAGDPGDADVAYEVRRVRQESGSGDGQQWKNSGKRKWSSRQFQQAVRSDVGEGIGARSDARIRRLGRWPLYWRHRRKRKATGEATELDLLLQTKSAEVSESRSPRTRRSSPALGCSHCSDLSDKSKSSGFVTVDQKPSRHRNENEQDAEEVQRLTNYDEYEEPRSSSSDENWLELKNVSSEVISSTEPETVKKVRKPRKVHVEHKDKKKKDVKNESGKEKPKTGQRRWWFWPRKRRKQESSPQQEELTGHSVQVFQMKQEEVDEETEKVKEKESKSDEESQKKRYWYRGDYSGMEDDDDDEEDIGDEETSTTSEEDDDEDEEAEEEDVVPDVRPGEGDKPADAAVDHVSVYSKCSTTPAQSIIVRGRYGFTNFEGKYPCVHINGVWPNTLRRMYRSNIVQRSIANLAAGLTDVQKEIHDENRMVASEKLKTVLGILSKDCGDILKLITGIVPEDTNLYRERKRYYRNEIAQIQTESATTAQKKVLLAEEELKRVDEYMATLKRFADDPEDSFPDTEIWLVKDGKRVAQHRMRTQRIVFSARETERGIRSGRVQSVLVRGKDGTVAAKLEMFMWFGLSSDFLHCRDMLPAGFQHETHACRGTARTDIPTLLTYTEQHHFRCRVHLFQGRVYVGADSNGLADPYVRVTVLGQHRSSQVREATLNPAWDETLVFPKVTVFGPGSYARDNPATVTVEVFDKDVVTRNELIGRAHLKPTAKLIGEEYAPPKLSWEIIRKDCYETGDVLLACEFLEVIEAEADATDEDDTNKAIPIPKDIRPNMVGHRLEVLFWGVREVAGRTPGPTKIHVTIECGGKVIASPSLKSASRSPNFPGQVQILDLDLPEDHDYKPALIVKMYESSSFVLGYETYVGSCFVPSAREFFCATMGETERRLEEMAYAELELERKRLEREAEAAQAAEAAKGKRKATQAKLEAKMKELWETLYGYTIQAWDKFKCSLRRSCAKTESYYHRYEDDKEVLDWWVKYYASKDGGRSDVDTLVIYDEELEAQPEFRGFTDFIYTFDIVTGKSKKSSSDRNLVGKVKAAVKLYRWPLEGDSAQTIYGMDVSKGLLKQMPSNEPIRYVARVYIVSCKNLTPKDLYGKSDPYLIVQVGGHKINDEKNYVAKQVNPTFGKCFEFRGIFPNDHLLRVRVMDKDVVSGNDLIGETRVDLESRYYTKHHACCGLPKKYRSRGYAAWRDTSKPTEILRTVCRQSNVAAPVYSDAGVRIGPYEFRADVSPGDKYLQEMHALAALNRWHEVPLRGFHLVPEHVETRPLYHPAFPGVEQGKIEMWIDIFPADFRYVPPVVDIEPQRPVPMELRAIVWNVEGVILDDTTFFFNEKMSDIYVQGWLTAMEEDRQSTDVHYRSMNGEGNFNWRFVFPFEYVAAERRLVVRKKRSPLDMEAEEMNFPCRLELQVWDNDFLSDDFLGSLTLELCSIPRGSKISTTCKLSMFEETAPRINLFKIRRTRGWWPFKKIRDKESSEFSLTGKIDLELEVVTEAEAKENPVGKGREGPEPLPPPKRPASSFVWFLNPFKTFRYIILRKYRKYIIIILVVALVVAFFAVGIYSFPGYTVKKIIGA